MKTHQTLPLVSVYIPTKNRMELLKRAIDSVLSQSYLHIEIVVVDDGSTDGTREYLNGLSEISSIRPIFMPVSVGACNARNFAISAATGEFVTGLDDDDYFEPNRIRDFVDRWQEGSDQNIKPAGIFDGIRIVRNGSQSLVASSCPANINDLKVKNTIGNQVFAPREHFIGAGLFDNTLPCWQDWDLWCRIAKKYGDFVSCGNFSYVQDLKSTADRISTQPGFVIRYAAKRFKLKHGPYSMSESADFASSLCDYPQVKLYPSELVMLAGSWQMRPLARKLAQNLLPPSAYASLRELVNPK
ncbi:glycosyltransferase family 2 protein [Paraburkholderia sediminicola]|uniref:glycosyltransferase family 2 protein n=1 Tax=Paraburkholderia sediminicola TaxID=458836 RepID=UPI0038BA7CF6